MKYRYRLLTIKGRLPWILSGILFLLFLLLILVGNWRSTGTGAQVQVPMFYDAHYLFPRPWTQSQEAPGVPPPAPVAFYGANKISQPFISGADHLQMIEVWLAGPEETAVTATFSTAEGQHYQATFTLSKGQKGGWYILSFPEISEAEGESLVLTLSAPSATAGQPVITHAIGGDRVGGAVQLNEYGRPGNLRLRTYVGGTAVFDALAEQILPDNFRLRLQQFKPEPFKGQAFALLFGLMVLLTTIFLVLARPSGQQIGQAIGWTCAGLLGGLLIWQLSDGRIKLPRLSSQISLTESKGTDSFPIDDLRIVNDMILTLWSANREPEARFVETAIRDLPAIQVPGQSKLTYALDMPRNGRLETSVYAEGQGEMVFKVLFNDELLVEVTAVVGEPAQSLTVDLTKFAGQGGELALVTEIVDGEPTGVWYQPQLLAQVDWLFTELPPGVRPAGHQLGEDVSLLAYTIEPDLNDRLVVTLYWQTGRPLTENATVFVHLLDKNGDLIAQNDSQPVQNSYPLTVWPQAAIIRDPHILSGEDGETIAVGLYNPANLERWPVINPDGTEAADGRVLLPVEVSP